MFIGLRIMIILLDLLLANILFYRPLSKKEKSKKAWLFLSLIIFFHITLAFLFLESRFFLISNIIFSIVEYCGLGLYFGYSFRISFFWVLLHTSLTLLAGAVLNQAAQLFLPLTEISGNMLIFTSYLMVNFFLSAGVTLALRKLFINHHRLTFEISGERWLYQFILPLLLVFFTFTISAIQGQVFASDYLSFISLLSLLIFTTFFLYFTLTLSQHYQRHYQNILEKEQLQLQLRETQQSHADYLHLQSIRHDLKNKHVTLLSLLEENPEEAKHYLYSLTDSIKDRETFYCKNPKINFLLNQKTHGLSEKIAMEIECFVPRELPLPPDILAVILGNCLDNSIAACLRLPNSTDRKLSLNIRYFRQHLFI